jgi:hypothetical protein
LRSLLYPRALPSSCGTTFPGSDSEIHEPVFRTRAEVYMQRVFPKHMSVSQNNTFMYCFIQPLRGSVFDMRRSSCNVQECDCVQTLVTPMVYFQSQRFSQDYLYRLKARGSEHLFLVSNSNTGRSFTSRIAFGNGSVNPPGIEMADPRCSTSLQARHGLHHSLRSPDGGGQANHSTFCIIPLSTPHLELCLGLI